MTRTNLSKGARQRANRIIDDWTGRMLNHSTPCIVFERAVCKGRFHGLSKRRTDTYWHEIWLEREAEPEATGMREVRA
jgi:hypothetical protein